LYRERVFVLWPWGISNERETISPDLTVSKLLKSEPYRYPDDADRLRKLLIEAGLPE
jgi:hypothetical protein